jgi:hypothetical protein
MLGTAQLQSPLEMHYKPMNTPNKRMVICRYHLFAMMTMLTMIIVAMRNDVRGVPSQHSTPNKEMQRLNANTDIHSTILFRKAYLFSASALCMESIGNSLLLGR